MSFPNHYIDGPSTGSYFVRPLGIDITNPITASPFPLIARMNKFQGTSSSRIPIPCRSYRSPDTNTTDPYTQCNVVDSDIFVTMNQCTFPMVEVGTRGRMGS